MCLFLQLKYSKYDYQWQISRSFLSEHKHIQLPLLIPDLLYLLPT